MTTSSETPIAEADVPHTTQAVRHVVEHGGASTVGIGTRWGQGSGVVVAPGRVLTNAHNVGGDEVGVVFTGGRTEVGTVLGSDVDAELAVIDVDTDEAPAVTPSVAAIDVGSPVVALANPGGRGIHATPGYVSAVGQRFRGPRRRRLAGAIEHTAPLVRGSSGGPVFDVAGGWLGLNTHRLGGGLYLALPVDDGLLSAIDRLAAGEEPSRRLLGIAVAPADAARRLRAAVGLDERDGLLVRDVDPDGPAAAAGIRGGDLIVSVAGTPVADVDDLRTALRVHDAGEALVVGLVRGADDLDVEVAPGG